MPHQLEAIQAVIPPRYRVEREIGRGGMAVVYLADDLQVGRRVAIKVLAQWHGSAINAERFAREIRVLGQLSHPNILPVLDSGEAGGQLYYVMPYIEGESLGARLRRERQLPLEDAIAIACEIADALTYAHAAGVVHRDIKPENVLLSGGHPVVADFGIARLLHEDDGSRLTKTGAALGTAAYMSPEQGAGDPVDARADQYSLACVLYELLVGEPPFTGPNSAAVLARHALELPPGIRVVRAAVPEAVEAAIMRALEKSPADRFKSVAELKAALLGEAPAAFTARYSARYTARYSAGYAPARRSRMKQAVGIAATAMVVAAAAIFAWVRTGDSTPGSVVQQGAPSGPPPSSIAVLYFTDQSPDGSLGHIADGLTESLIDQLSGVSALDVVSANGVRGLRGTDVRADSVAHAFNVGTVVRGAVDPAGDGVRVSVDMIEPVSGASIGRRAFVFDADHLQDARDSVAAEVARLLRMQLGNEIRVREQRRATSSAAAWVAVQRAEKLRKEADSLIAVRALDDGRAVLDRADAELARAATLDTAWSEVRLLQAAVAFSRARAAGGDRAAVAAAAHAGLQQVDAVVASDPRNARAHELRGQLVFYGILRSPTVGVREGEKLLQVAESSLVMAVRLDRQRAGAWATLSELHYRKPDLQAAALAAMTAYEADAYLANARSILVRLVSVAYDLEQYNEARAWCDRGRQRLPRDPFFSQCRLLIMWMRAAEGTPPDSAWQHAASYVERTGSDQRPFAEEMARVLVAGALARGQLKDSARVVLQSVRTDAVVDPHRELAGYAAAVRVILGDHDEAVRLLTDYLTANPGHRKGFATRTGWWWRDLQTHPKFIALIAGAR